MKRGGAGNSRGEHAVFEDMKQEEPITFSVKMPFFEHMKQEDEKGWSR